MSLVSDDLHAGFVRLLSVAAETLTITSYDHECLASSLERGTILDLGGFEYEIAARFQVACGDWITFDSTGITMDGTTYTMDDDTGLLSPGARCTFRGVVYRVASISFDPSMQRATLHCISPNK